MKAVNTPSRLAQPFDHVNPSNSVTCSPTFPSVIHHKDHIYSKQDRLIVSYKTLSRSYGVSSSYRVLSKDLLIKKFDYIRDCLKQVLELTTAQREVTLRLLRLWAYYGNVYPKESQITELPGCSKATYWRTIKLLEELGLLTRINRYVVRPHAQISNLYRFDLLIVLLAKYLAEHIAHVWADWLDPWLRMEWPDFWSYLAPGPGDRASPSPPLLAELAP